MAVLFKVVDGFALALGAGFGALQAGVMTWSKVHPYLTVICGNDGEVIWDDEASA